MANTVVSVGHTDFGLFAWEYGTERKLFLQTRSPRLSEPVPCDWNKGRLGPLPSSSSRAGGAPAAQPLAAIPRQLPPSSSKLKPGSGGKNGCATTDMPSPRSKLGTSGGKGRVYCITELLLTILVSVNFLQLDLQLDFMFCVSVHFRYTGSDCLCASTC